VLWLGINGFLKRISKLVLHPDKVSILFNAIIKGVLCAFNICRTSAVCGFIPSFTLTTTIAKSAK
jgi:hypothetical protein